MKETLPVAIVVGVQTQGNELEQVHADLDELTRLLDTLGFQCSHRVVQKCAKLSAAHLIGLGKLQELQSIAASTGATYVVVDHALTGAQVKNIESLTCCKVLDRSAVILDIFAKHAKSKEAKTQVEIARLEYQLPRMVGAWTHFVKQSGGHVAMRGAGEKQIEIDRRRARERISSLQKKLDVIRKERDTQRKLRRNELKVSIVGYTNSGKTTLMNGLTHCGTQGEDRLFATLDASVRAIDPGTRPSILLSDTVGFIRKLPPTLVASFMSTLEEVLNADLLIHVVDVSDPNFELQMQTTENVLNEIGAASVPVVLVFNKIDRIHDPLMEKLLRKKFRESYFVSAFSMDHMKLLRSEIFRFFTEQFEEAHIRLPYDQLPAWSLVHRSCVILQESYEAEGYGSFHVKAPTSVLAKLQNYIAIG